MYNRILFLARKNDLYSEKLTKYLKKISQSVKIHYSSRVNEKIKKSIFDVKEGYYDYIFSFRSYFILKKAHIKKAKFAAINFHPGSPNYRGFGPASFAIYDGTKKYGVTAHLMNNKIDSGKIINIKLFKISKNENINTLLKKTHKFLFEQAKKVIIFLNKNPNNLKKMLSKNDKIKWSKKIYKKKDLEIFYEIKLHDTKKNIDKKIKATLTSKFKPFIKLNNKKLFITDK